MCLSVRLAVCLSVCLSRAVHAAGSVCVLLWVAMSDHISTAPPTPQVSQMFPPP